MEFLKKDFAVDKELYYKLWKLKLASGIMWQKTEGESWIGLQRQISRMELGKIRSWQVRKVKVGLKVSLTRRCISKNDYMTSAISLFIFYLNFENFIHEHFVYNISSSWLTCPNLSVLLSHALLNSWPFFLYLLFYVHMYTHISCVCCVCVCTSC